MGSSASTLRNGKTTPETRASNFKSKAIDKTLLKAKSEEENIFKILLLGGSECGKTTIFKQMRILHLNGFTKEVSISFRSFIHGNTMEALNQLIDACNSFILTHDISVQEDIARFNDFKKKLRDPEEFVIPVTIGRCMDRIWHSSTIQTAYDRRFSYQLPDSAKYFLDNICRLTEDMYVPSTQDILHCRFRTTGINEISFTHKKLNFKMVDVGGQRTERRKWIHCFDNVNMILFVVSMSDYDLQDPEDSRQNRMLQNFEIFRTIVQSEFFKNATVVLFLNKYDVFRDKLNSSPLQKCWSHYNGDNSVDDATEFMKKQFRRCIHERHKYFNFVTTATDTNNIELVFSSAIAHIINESLKSTGLHE